MPEALRIKKFREFVDNNRDKKILLFAGGKDTGKSTFVQQTTLRDMYELRGMRNMMIRATGPSLQDSLFDPMMEMLNEWGTPYSKNLSRMVIRAGSNTLLFKSIDKQAGKHKKFGSINVNDVVIEEAPELSWQEFIAVELQARRANPNRSNRIMACCNTDDPFSWVREYIAEGNRKDVATLYTTVYDNPFATAADIAILEGLKEQNMSLYLAHCLGQWAAPEGTVYSNYTVSAEGWPEAFDEVILGQDVGTVNQMATVEIGLLDERPWEAWVRQRLYRKGMNDSDLKDWYIQDIGGRPRIDFKRIIYCDTDPGTIMELDRAGYHRICPADKKSVAQRVKFIRRYRLHLHPNDLDMLKEIRGYVFRTDRRGHSMEEPVKYNDHLMNAMEYALYTHYIEKQGAPMIYLPKHLRQKKVEA